MNTNEKLLLWYENLLLRIGLVRVARYITLMERYHCLSTQFEANMAYGDTSQLGKVDAYTSKEK